MAFPSYIPTRVVTVGGAIGLESASPLKIKVSIVASRSLVWAATGYRFEATGVETETEVDGGEISLALPVTDLDGWRVASTGAVIDMSAPDSHSHTYSVQVTIGRKTYPYGPFVLPSGDEPVDLDLTVPAATVAGESVAIPDTWSTQLAEARALSAEAVTLLEEVKHVGASDAAMATVAADPASAFSQELSAQIGAVTASQVPPLVAQAIADDDTVVQAAADAVTTYLAEHPIEVAGDVPIFATLADAQAWEAANPGRVALTLDDGKTHRAAVPVADDELNTISIPDDPRVQYVINGAPVTGVYSVGNVDATVVVTAVPLGDIELVGDTMWVFTFHREAMTRVAAATAFDHPDDTPLSGMALDTGGIFGVVEETYPAVVVGGAAVQAHRAANRISGTYRVSPAPVESGIRSVRVSMDVTAEPYNASVNCGLGMEFLTRFNGQDYPASIMLRFRADGETAIEVNPRLTLDSTEPVMGIPRTGRLVFDVQGQALSVTMGGVPVAAGMLNYPLSETQDGGMRLAGEKITVDNYLLELGS